MGCGGIHPGVLKDLVDTIAGTPWSFIKGLGNWRKSSLNEIWPVLLNLKEGCEGGLWKLQAC